MNKPTIQPARKPGSITDADWAEALRASRLGAFRYIFLSRRVLSGWAAMFLGVFCYHLYVARGDIPEAFSATMRGGMFLGFAFLLLFVGIAEAIEWHGRRQLVLRQQVADADPAR
ncbi:MAG: hypothetical protein V4710_20145 [Verrucomicrobiota bacterium]